MSIPQQIRQMTEATKEGADGHDPKLIYLELRNIVALATQAAEEVKPLAITEVQKYGREGFRHDGVVVTVKAAAGTWSGYEKCEEYNATKMILDAWKKRMRMSYKAQADGGNLIEFDGTVVPAAIYIPGADTLNVSKRKP